MFDEVPKEPQDMFSEIDASAPQVAAPTMTLASDEPVLDSAVAAPALTADMPMASSPSVGLNARMSDRTSARKSFPWKVIAFVVILLVVIGLAFVLAMRILKAHSTIAPVGTVAAPTTQTPSPVSTTTPSTPASVPTAAPAPTTTTSTIDPNLDSDKDGLTDVQEAQLGTNPNNPDTDSDGLTDYEEVKVYHTNPLNPDTDGDGYKDGDEVKNGYNPNGPGKLLVVPTVK